jgi:hypothetical protein
VTESKKPIPEHLGTPEENSILAVNDAGGHMDTRFGADVTGRVIFWIAVTFSCFQIFTAAWAILPSQVVRSVHVGFLLLLLFALVARRAPAGSVKYLFFWALAIFSFAIGLYHWVFYVELIVRAGDPSTTDIVVGVIAIVLVFEAARRMMGIALPIICGAFLAYALLGHLLPNPLNHRGYYFEQVIEQVYLGTEGIYGIPTYVSSTFIFLFILFGAFLERAGMIQLFNDIAMGTVGHTRGGPAKVSVVSSGLMGTINGSGVANVVTTGQFTIRLMKRFGFTPAFAGGVEATASMGGQIMPPVMGAVAFIMAETLDVSYAEVVTAAVIPAFLYFFTAFWMVHLEAGRKNLMGLPKEECPSALDAIREKWYLVLPLIALVYLLFSGYTPLFAGLIGLSLTVFIILGLPISGILSIPVLRVVFWVALGLAAAAFFEYGISIIAVTTAPCSRSICFPRRPRDAEDGDRKPRRRRAQCAARRHRLRHCRRHHRRPHPHRRRLNLRARDRRRRRRLDLHLARADGAHEPPARHGHSHDPELHHHLVDRRPRARRARRAAHRLAHVRLLFRHHGGPDAARGARGLRRRTHRQGDGIEDRPHGRAASVRRASSCPSWRSIRPR